MFIINDIYELNESIEYINSNKDDSLILSGGSNILFKGNYNGTVIKLDIKGIHIAEKTSNHIFLRVNCGEEWDEFVSYSVSNNWGGAENLSLIPGKVGASPIQNIGAYGAELKDIFYSLEAMDVQTGTLKTFGKEDCEFGYRNSIFKNALKNKFIICSVTFKLDINHNINSSYKAIEDYFIDNNISKPKISDVRRAVISIRKEKLPDPEFLGNAGSFFKNPIISKEKFEKIKEKNPGIVSHKEKNQIKLSAGWLIEQAGWKGYRKNDAGVYDKQALVIVNYGNAKSKDILELSEIIKESVFNKFGVKLEEEVTII